MDTEKSQQEKFLSAYNANADPIFRFVYFKVHDRELALDLVQEVFYKAWEYLSAGKNVENFRAFLYKIASNLVIDHYRKKKTESLEFLNEEKNFEPADPLARSDEVAEVAQAILTIKTLEPQEQELIIWRYVEDWTIAEISKALRQTENATSVQIHRALKKLRELLNK